MSFFVDVSQKQNHRILTSFFHEKTGAELLLRPLSNGRLLLFYGHNFFNQLNDRDVNKRESVNRKELTEGQGLHFENFMKPRNH